MSTRGGVVERFISQKVTTHYREERPTKHHGTELRWLINEESVKDTSTGEVITRGVLRHPGICVIVPLLSPDQILLMRQYRFAAGQELWELPAGTISGEERDQRMVATESPEACAARELLEESGYEAGRIRKMAECFAMPGSSDEMIYIFLATELIKRQQSLDIGEMISEIRPFTAGEISGMISRNEIRDAKTLIGLFFALGRQPNGLQIA